MKIHVSFVHVMALQNSKLVFKGTLDAFKKSRKNIPQERKMHVFWPVTVRWGGSLPVGCAGVKDL